jgi:hypothetical protein
VNPQQPYQPPVTQWPGAGPYPGPGGPGPARPSGATGVLGGLSAALGGLVLLGGTIWALVQIGGTFGLLIDAVTPMILLVLQLLASVLLLIGGLLLCLRVGFGRFVIPVGTVVVLAIVLLAIVQEFPFGAVIPPLWFALLHVQDIVWFTLVLALAGSLFGLVPSTARWVSTLQR